MARENHEESVRSIDHDFAGAAPIYIDCPSCDRDFTLGEWTEPARGQRAKPSCPTCDESFTVRVCETFALVERGGWAVSVSVGREGCGQ